MTTTPAMPELPEPELGYIETNKSRQPAFSARQMRAAMQAQPADVSDADVWELWLRVCAESENLSTRVMIANFARAILALRPQSEPAQPRTFDARNAQFREENWQIRFDAAVEARRAAQEQLYTERERHAAEVKRLQTEIGRLQSLRPQAVPMTDEQKAAPKLIGWRTENFLWETDDVDKARNWEPNIGVLPIFEGDPNTKLGSRGITAQAKEVG